MREPGRLGKSRMPSLVATFWISFAITLLLVGGTVFTGLSHRRRVHVGFALCTVASLIGTIVLAERLGAARNFPAAEMRVHLWFAKSAALAVVPVVLTGVALWRWRRARWAHRAAVALFLLLTVIATATGTWAYGLSTPK